MSKLIGVILLAFCTFVSFAQPKLNYRFKKTNTGLQYKIIKKGKGRKVQSSLRCFFDYSYFHKSDTGKIKTIVEYAYKDFIIGQEEVLKGWDEAFLLLREGDSAIFSIPPSLAYGNKKVGTILPNSTLFLIVRLKKVQDAFFNHTGKDTITFSSGLKKILVEKGIGIKPSNFNEVRMRFTGYAYSTTGFKRVFQSSYTNSAEAVFQLGTGRMLRGMDEGVASMEVGEKATLIIPPQLGFGSQQVGLLLPNSIIYIDIELVSSNFPVFQPQQKNIHYFSDSSFLSFLNKKDTTRISYEDIVSFNYKIYYFIEEGKPLVFDNSYERLQPVVQRPGSGLGLPFADLGLLQMGSGEKSVLKLPSKEVSKYSNNPKLLTTPFVFIDLDIVKVEKYPFMKLTGSDTVLKYSGLKYINNLIGSGDSVKRGDVVTVFYTVYCLNDSGVRRVLDCSYEKGKVMEIIVGSGNNIPGVEEGLLGMRNGGSRRLIIPPYLGYGDNGLQENGLPPKTDLIFDIESIQILKK